MQWRLGALLVALCAIPASGQSPPQERLEVPYRQFTLDNGLNVILHRDASVPVVSVNVWYRVGSANERPGRTGLAHLFEHLMFEGSRNVGEGVFDTLLEAAGGSSNASTDNDYTNYYIDVPANALELALFLESDRMGYLVDALSPQRVDVQRDVVMNERRQSLENRPYGMASLELDRLLWPEGHPYRWPIIGSMEDLAAASHADVAAFFKTYYVPGNASLAIAGDIDLDRARALVEKWFGGIPGGSDPPAADAPPARLEGVTRRTITDRVQLPRLYMAWLTPPMYAPGDAALDVASVVLAGGRSSRLYTRLVYEMQIAQDVSAAQRSGALGSSFVIVATARPGHTGEQMQRVIDEELDRLRSEPPTPREVERARNQIQASFYRQMERVGGFGGKANQLNAYYFAGAGPDFFAEDLARYTSLAPADVHAAVLRWLPGNRRVELLVDPEVER